MKKMKEIYLHSDAAETYIRPTHYDGEQINRTNPNTIGFRIMPFPLDNVMPESLPYRAKLIPRCSNCHSFYNCYNNYINDPQPYYECSICGTKNSLQARMDIQGIEFTNQVYEAYTQGDFLIRQVFKPTDVLVFSLSLLKSTPDIIDKLVQTYQILTTDRQIALIILHGMTSVIKFRPDSSIISFLDDIGIARAGEFFIGIDRFISELPRIKDKILSLNKTYSESGPYVGIDFAAKLASQYGSSLYYYLDGSDFESTPLNTTYTTTSMFLSRNGVQVKLFVFGANSRGSFPLTDLAAFSGGCLRLYPQPTPSVLLSELQRNILQTKYHDCFLKMVGPGGSPVANYSGQGYLTSGTAAVVPKIEPGQTFWAGFDVRRSRSRAFQFVVFYFTELGTRKLRVLTFKAPPRPLFDENLQREFVRATVAHALLLDGTKAAAGRLKSLQTAFEIEVPDAANLLTLPQLTSAEIAIDVRDGRPRKIERSEEDEDFQKLDV